jgi:hypothetical protein
MGNLSVFTTLLSGGMGLLVVFLYFVPAQGQSSWESGRNMAASSAAQNALLSAPG